ncbi:bifunctional ADP-dependent NAD(P)H-hydrate dehydratase/NAD(P)H-hydrate epimerase [Sporosarcina sp. P3]|uniref:NAD(P)H-hydrate dehydratase n=1 Tax=Sporosarcina sp. P3 TaxID=2048245 RepID=UPI000C16AC5E|nr:NAD(P)H-hydrate dehydratase [Sporosarcina sp. P3]PID21094.1 bifunctional ADP-dependent NAD(P)H-hydrate dehydratase/NAD(P)H-hydrate epimerase [Sporosarcina sp. P3]
MFAAGREDMRQMDQYTIETLGLPGTVLMENAGAKVADELLRRASDMHDAKFLVVAGGGNNGGDGFVIARRLLDEGKHCTLCLAVDPVYIQGDAKVHFDVYRNRKLPIVYVNEETRPELQRLLIEADYIVDALLGTGATGEIREPIRSVIELVNQSGKYVVAVDVPSGVNSDTGEVADLAVCANQTITFVVPKKGFFLQQGPQYIGNWKAVNISVPLSIVDELSLTLPCVITQSVASAAVPKRPKHGHKGTFGHVLVLGGSKSYVGAPIFTAKAALHSGAGLVTLGVPQGMYPMAATQLPEALFWPMEETDGHFGNLFHDGETFHSFDVVAVGPGLSRFEGGESWMRSLWESLSGQPVVVDADGLFLSRNMLDIICRYEGPVVCTPHPGEMAMLLNTTVQEVETNRLEIAKQFAEEHQLYLLLKGHRSIIATPDGEVYMNPVGSDALGKGGSGDVLTGLIASFLAQGATPKEAMIAAAYVHAEAGENQAEVYSNYGVVAPDIIEGCKVLLKEWTE